MHLDLDAGRVDILRAVNSDVVRGRVNLLPTAQIVDDEIGINEVVTAVLLQESQAAGVAVPIERQASPNRDLNWRLAGSEAEARASQAIARVGLVSK